MVTKRSSIIFRLIAFLIVAVILISSLYTFVLRETSSMCVSIEELWRDRGDLRQFSGRDVTVSGQIASMSENEGVIRLFDKDWYQDVDVFLAATDSGIEKRMREIRDLDISNLTVRGIVEYDKEYTVQVTKGILVSPSPVLWMLSEILPTVTAIVTFSSGTMIFAFFNKLFWRNRTKQTASNSNG